MKKKSMQTSESWGWWESNKNSATGIVGLQDQPKKKKTLRIGKILKEEASVKIFPKPKA